MDHVQREPWRRSSRVCLRAGGREEIRAPLMWPRLDPRIISPWKMLSICTYCKVHCGHSRVGIRRVKVENEETSEIIASARM